MPLPQGAGRPGHQAHGLRLPAADVNISGNDLVHRAELRFSLFHQVQNFAGPPAEQNAILCQGDLPVSPEKQFLTQFLLQIHQLAGERRLGQVQIVGCGGDVFLPRDGKEITQDAKFHVCSFPM